MNILFVLPVLSDSYYRKRIEKISGAGAKCTVLGFERENHYPGKPWQDGVKSMGLIRHGHYLSRIGTLLRAVLQIHREAGGKDVIYAFNLDILFICWLGRLFRSKKIKIIYDVADIRNILIGDGFIPFILRILERFLLRRTSIVVVASPAYIDGYFKKIQNVDHNFFVIENKVEEDLFVHSSQPEPESKSDEWAIGYFGMLRCIQSLKTLKQLIARSNGSFHLRLRGVFLNTERFEDQFKRLDHAFYGGPFLYPDDLEEMYSKIDLVWAAHMHGETNTKWSVSNRFFQGCCFKIPIIAQKGTQDAKLVQKYEIGLVIDLTEPDQAIQTIQSIGKDEIEKWTYNLYQIPKEVYTLTDEHERLLHLIKSTG